MDKTKWYGIDYQKLQLHTEQYAIVATAKSAEEEAQFALATEGEETKSIKKDIVEHKLDVVSVIDYLNDKTSKQFKASSQATARLVTARLSEGNTVVDFKKIIDTKAKAWLGDSSWQKYLRPSTLFNATNFENYLEESRGNDLPASGPPKPPELDFSRR